MTDITLTTKQRQILDQALDSYIEQLLIQQREHTYSGIVVDRLKIAYEIQRLLRTPRPTDPSTPAGSPDP